MDSLERRDGVHDADGVTHFLASVKSGALVFTASEYLTVRRWLEQFIP
jgi:hypothetical protein